MREHRNQSYTTPRFSRFDWLEIIDKNRAHFNVARDKHPSALARACGSRRFSVRSDHSTHPCSHRLTVNNLENLLTGFAMLKLNDMQPILGKGNDKTDSLQDHVLQIDQNREHSRLVVHYY